MYRVLELNLRIKPRKRLAIDVVFSLLFDRLIRLIDQSIEWRGRQLRILFDNEPFYVASVILAWAEKRSIHIEFIGHGQLQQNT
jgi:putative transposase